MFSWCPLQDLVVLIAGVITSCVFPLYSLHHLVLMLRAWKYEHFVRTSCETALGVHCTPEVVTLVRFPTVTEAVSMQDFNYYVNN